MDILEAECGCPGGKGPTASCKHIAALCYAFLNFCEHGSLPDFLTCTEQLQKWNQPRKRHLDPIPVTAIREHQQAIVNPTKHPRNPCIPLKFDPRPPNLRHTDTKAIEKLRVNLANIHPPCALLTVLVPLTTSIEHDHTYSRKPAEVDNTAHNSNNNSNVSSAEECIESYDDVASQIIPDDVLTREIEQLQVTFAERSWIEENTRTQRENSLWYEVRFKRLTGSKSSQVLCQKSWTPSLLQRIIYQKPFIFTPAPIQWGIDHEITARRKYTAFMHESHSNLTVEDCGFFIHPQEGWIGASPDGVVHDPSHNPPHGILEIKCPYSMREKPLSECCQDCNFYCFIDETGRFRLKRDHAYYHQVQVQLFVCSDQYKWCDFCVYTTKGVMVERIWTDCDWIEKFIPILENFFRMHYLPEILYPKLKPSYFL